ncbi:Dyp-type peroxidase [Liquorilactobacillus vini]|uniref:Tyra protein n=1 Tax=Liquorilactobacillus vini DSM 20605 TaxID=1133569 RepID=A0A0R2CCG7_9LACO|nr:Dyp-type peroxidase [Liquorilactobacillus vini]KRM89066.1 tyra protein [Liquorilactobacillus vini DSM 20605]
MVLKINQAQDVWKDVGQQVQFTVLKLKRQDPEKERQKIREFADRYQAIIRSLRIRSADLNQQSSLKVTFGFSFQAWTYLFPNAAWPKELETYQTLTSDRFTMPATDGDLFFHIRADNEAIVYEAQSQFRHFLKEITTVVDETKGFRYFEGRAIIGFIDGTEAPEAKDAAEYALIGDEDPVFANGSYAFAQKWLHNMEFWDHLKTEQQEKGIGRKKFSDYELDEQDKYHNAHNISSKIEINGQEQKIVRMNVPFSDPAAGKTGTYFIGYARHWKVTKKMLEQMLATSDFLLSFSTIISGQLFFIPSYDLLNQISSGEFK